MGIGASFYMRPGRKASINLTWIRNGQVVTEESVRWYFNDVVIDFSGGRVETVTNNGETILKQYSVNYPDIYLMREVGVTQAESLVIDNVSKEKSDGRYKGAVSVFR